MHDHLFGQVPPYSEYADPRDWRMRDDEDEALRASGSPGRTISLLRVEEGQGPFVGPPNPPFAIPPKHDFRGTFPPVREQLGMDCSSQAVMACMEQTWLRLTGKPFRGSPEYAYLISRCFQYQSREGKWSLKFDLVSPTRCLEALRKVGCCEEQWFSSSYINVEETVPENHVVIASAMDHRIEEYKVVDPVWIKFLLANDVSIVVVVKWARDLTQPCFWSSSISSPADCIRFPDPDDIEEWKAYDHAMVLSGYDDELGHFWARSSSSRRWADNGYVQIPYTWYDGYMFGWWTVTHVRGRGGVT